MLATWKKSYDQPRQHIQKQRYYFANKGLSSQSYGFSSSHVWMWELDYKESWAPKNWCFWTVVLEKTLESPLDCKEIKPVSPKGNQSWIFIGRTDAESPILFLATWCEELTYLKRPWCWEILKVGGEGDNIGWDGWMTSPTQWTWVWASSGSWWWTVRPVVLQSMGSQSWTLLSDWTELNWGCSQGRCRPQGALGDIWSLCAEVCFVAGGWGGLCHSGPFQSLLGKSLSGLSQGVRCHVYWAEERRVPMTWPVGSRIRSHWILYTFLEGLRQCQCLRVCRPLKARILCV